MATGFSEACLFIFLLLLVLLCVRHCAIGAHAIGIDFLRSSAEGAESSFAFDPVDYTYVISQSTPSTITLWTAPATRRVLSSDTAPPAASSSRGLVLDAAGGEFEPVQVVVAPTSVTDVTVGPAPLLSFGGGAVLNWTLHVVGFSQPPVGHPVYPALIADRLVPHSFGASVALSTTSPTVLWLTAHVPRGAPAGVHTPSALQLTPQGGGGAIAVPVSLTVWGFDLPVTNNFHGLYEGLPSITCGSVACLDVWKQVYLEHRLTPESTAWPSGMTSGITWDSSANPGRCSALFPEPQESCQYSAGCLTRRYGLGLGSTWRSVPYADWLGEGFADPQVLKFVSNSQSRPSDFCGQPLSASEIGPVAYNVAFGAYLAALELWLANQTAPSGTTLVEKAYWYVRNEPQNAADHRIAAALCNISRHFAPRLRLAVSEEPKPEIAEDACYPCGYDVWIAHMAALQNQLHYSQVRQRHFGETVWAYSLDNDRFPFLSPCRGSSSLNTGPNYRAIAWVGWATRYTGWGYYNMRTFFDVSAGALEPRMGAELLRESFEDYEFLLAANNGSHPASCASANALDRTVRSVGACLTSWSADPALYKALRYELARFVTGQIPAPPVFGVANPRARQTYRINFGDPGNSAIYPMVGTGPGEEWATAGWEAYDPSLGYGWCGPFIGDAGIMLYADAGSGNVVESSYLYNDYGRVDEFHLALENGVYNVTAAIGIAGRSRTDESHVLVEGVPLHIGARDSRAQQEYWLVVEVKDEMLTLTVGVFQQYTFLAYLVVEPSAATPTPTCERPNPIPGDAATCPSLVADPGTTVDLSTAGATVDLSAAGATVETSAAGATVEISAAGATKEISAAGATKEISAAGTAASTLLLNP